jgi:hypothetical protein
LRPPPSFRRDVALAASSIASSAGIGLAEMLQVTHA